ncbi:MAG: glycosyltransferase [Planctomycetes bacterium]|nr:glycosyltransferase [Planctomycetota bacterium]
MRTLLALSTLPREGPSVRPRVLAYGPHLLSRGIRLDFRPFLTDDAFRGFYAPDLAARARRTAWSLLGGLRRSAALLGEVRADAVLVHREILPRGNRLALAALRRRGLRYLHDLDDALWLAPRDYVADGELSRRRMTLLKDPGETDGLLAGATLVLAGNETIAAHAAERNPAVRLMPTVVDTSTFRPREKGARRRPLVGWIGSPTATYCLKAILPALVLAAERTPFDLLVVGAGEALRVPGVKVETRAWSLAKEPALFSSLDVGLYPLPDNPWTRGKCGMKAIQYLASGVAAVVSPVGVNTRIVEDGRTGFFATGPGEWTDRLVRYLADPVLRAEHGARGREAVERGWSLATWGPRFSDAVLEVLA